MHPWQARQASFATCPLVCLQSGLSLSGVESPAHPWPMPCRCAVPAAVSPWPMWICSAGIPPAHCAAEVSARYSSIRCIRSSVKNRSRFTSPVPAGWIMSRAAASGSMPHPWPANSISCSPVNRPAIRPSQIHQPPPHQSVHRFPRLRQYRPHCSQPIHQRLQLLGLHMRSMRRVPASCTLPWLPLKID